MQDVVKVGLAIVTLGLISTLVINGAGTAKVVSATTGGFAQDVGAAERG
jgi:hypothetical protein